VDVGGSVLIQRRTLAVNSSSTVDTRRAVYFTIAPAAANRLVGPGTHGAGVAGTHSDRACSCRDLRSLLH
jgi:hypothetical protein